MTPIETYIEFNASKSGFCLVTDECYPKLIKGGFEFIKPACDWGVENGYVVNVYDEGKLVDKLMPIAV